MFSEAERQLPQLRIGEYVSRYPVILGGMSIGTGGAELAAAVANAGGMGTIGGVGRGFLTANRKLARSFRDADCRAIENEINLAREISPDGILGVNVLMAARWHKPVIRAAVATGGERSKINYLVVGAGFHEGVPQWIADHPEVALILMASADLAAILMTKAWWREGKGRLPDAIVLEAPKDAGGHLGASRDKVYRQTLTLESTVPSLRKRLAEHGWEIPIIGAGGVWDRADIDRVLGWGGNGVQMATRFVCTPECAAPESFKQMYLQAKRVGPMREGYTNGDIVLVDSPVGYPGRAIYNKFLHELKEGLVHDRCKVNCLTRCLCRESKCGSHFCIIDRLVKAFEGDVENGLVFCGSNAYRSREQGIVPVKQILAELCTAGPNDT